jgi:SAM-dependent methyltransferase
MYGSQRMLFLGLLLAQEVMNTELPDYVSRRIAGEREVGYLAEIVCQQLFRKPDHLPHRLKKGFFYFRAKDSLQQKLRDGLRSLFIPTAEDCAFISLPNRLFPLYYLIRPIHLSGRYVLGRLKGQEEEVGFLPSKQSIVEKMLDLAQIQSRDVVYDPGCGDGRIVIIAAKRYGVRAVGIDIDPERIAECRIHARRENVEQLVTFIQQDVMQVDLSEASVLMLYMPSDWNQLILPKILRELRHGTRIVSNDTELGTFTPDKTELVLDERVVPPHFLYLWYVHRPSSEKGGNPLARIGRGKLNSA